jgi:predicted DNA binding protein
MLLLYDTDIGDGITDFLDELPALATLSISFSLPNKMRCEFIRDMKNTNNIEKIDIDNADIDDEILSEITRFKNLKSLSIRSSKITKDSIPVMESFANEERHIYLYNDDGCLFHSVPDWMR